MDWFFHKHTPRVVGGMVLALILVGAAGSHLEALDGPKAVGATATLHNAEGDGVGNASFTQTPHGVLIHLTAKLPAGTYALHIHSVGLCEGPGFTSCAGHFNPDEKEHGFLNPKGPHAGDLPNLFVDASGAVQQEILASGITLGEGKASILDLDGSALVIHGGADDYSSNPAGNAGPRIACGVISTADAVR